MYQSQGLSSSHEDTKSESKKRKRALQSETEGKAGDDRRSWYVKKSDQDLVLVSLGCDFISQQPIKKKGIKRSIVKVSGHPRTRRKSSQRSSDEQLGELCSRSWKGACERDEKT